MSQTILVVGSNMSDKNAGSYMPQFRAFLKTDKGKGIAKDRDSSLDYFQKELQLQLGDMTMSTLEDVLHHLWSMGVWGNKASVELLQSILRERSVLPYVGQCQKWINMSIKYAIALGERRLPGFSSVYEVAHIPLDSIVLDGLVTGLAGKKMDALPHTWSRIPEYAEYLSCQLWVRENLPGIPLEIEYRLWQRDPGNAGES